MLFFSLLSQYGAMGTLAWVVAILIALSTHEFSHALAGTLLGDPTAKSQGRLTLNPMSHIDSLGFFMLLLIGFGWGRPVPFNPYNLKYQKWGPALVAMAGPFANLVNIIIFGAALKLIVTFTALGPTNVLLLFLSFLLFLNTILMIFNLIPLPPLDGSKVLLSALSKPKYSHLRFILETRGPMILLFLVFFDIYFLGSYSVLGNLFRGAIMIISNIFGVSF